MTSHSKFHLSSMKMGMKRYFVYSLAVHFLIILTLSLSSELLEIFKINLNQNNPSVIDLSKQNTIRVDVVAMPDLTLEELKILERELSDSSTDSTVNETNAPVKDNSPKEYKAEQKESSLNDLLYEIGKKEIPKSETAKKDDSQQKVEQRKKLEMAQKLKGLIIKGNKLGQGKNLFGQFTQGQVSSDLVQYSQALVQQIKAYWKVPKKLIDKNLKCRIQIYLSKKGELIKLKVLESSGEKEYDEKAIHAIKEAAPYSEVPSAITEQVRSGNLVLGFPI